MRHGLRDIKGIANGKSCLLGQTIRLYFEQAMKPIFQSTLKTLYLKL